MLNYQVKLHGKNASRTRAEEENRTWYLGETLSAAIGQSYNNFTPIQMAKYISMLANGGSDIAVSVVKTVLEGMRGVTSEGGTAYSTFAGFNVEVAGKTGTAQAGNKTNGWFAGFAPYNNPEIAVVVVVENASSGGFTAEVARDIFAEYFGMNLTEVSESQEAIPSVQMNR